MLRHAAHFRVAQRTQLSIAQQPERIYNLSRGRDAGGTSSMHLTELSASPRTNRVCIVSREPVRIVWHPRFSDVIWLTFGEKVTDGADLRNGDRSVGTSQNLLSSGDCGTLCVTAYP